MGWTKDEVDKYVTKVTRTLSTGREKNMKGFAFARLYREARDVDKAQRHLEAYISESEGDFRAHRMMGQILEEKGLLEKAVASYRRSLDLNNTQHDLVLKVVELYCKVPIDPDRARAWADRAARLYPGHATVFKLRMHLLESAGKIDYDEIEDLIAEEMAKRPDAELHIRLVRLYAATGRLLDAYSHCVSVIKVRAFVDNQDWWACAAEIFEKYLANQQKMVPPNRDIGMGHMLLEAHSHLLAAQASLLDLYLKRAETRECLNALYRLDHSLYHASQYKVRKLSRKGSTSKTEWEVVLCEMSGQLYMFCGVLLLRLAKENYLTWPRAIKLACACFSASAQILEPDTKTPWVATGAKDKDPLRWYCMACSRLSTSGHFLMSMKLKYGEEWIDTCLSDWSSPQGKDEVVNTVYTAQRDLTTSFLAQDQGFYNGELNIPQVDQLVNYDEVRISNSPGDLQQIIWIGLSWYQCEGIIRPGVGFLVGRLFEELRHDAPDIERSAAETLCHRDLEAFIYAVVRTSAEWVLDDKETYLPDGQPKILPIQLCGALAMPVQQEWWNAAYSLYSGTGRLIHAGKVRFTVQKGLEVIRALGNHGLHVKLLIYLATSFGDKATYLKTSGAMPWFYEVHWKSLQTRSIHYWREAFAILGKLERNESLPVRKSPMFQPLQDTFQDSEVKTYMDKARLALGDAAVRDGRLEEAMEMYEPVKTFQGMWNLAEIYKYLAGVEAQAAAAEELEPASSPRGPPEEYYNCLHSAKDLFLQCKEIAPNNERKQEIEDALIEIEDMLNQDPNKPAEMPRKQLDFRQLHYQASRSSTTVSELQSEDNFWLDQPGDSGNIELIARLSEVTLNNGYLQEQMAVRDQKVESLSDKVQRLEAEVTELKQRSFASSIMSPPNIPSSPAAAEPRTPSQPFVPMRISPAIANASNVTTPSGVIASPSLDASFTPTNINKQASQNGQININAFQSTPIPKASVKSRLGPKPVPSEPPTLDPSFFAGLADTNSPEKRAEAEVHEDEGGSETSSVRHNSTSMDDVHFEPIIPLPAKVAVTTGEENEDVVFNKRAKLFRFDADDKAWKERGIGTFKILHTPQTDKFRILMRRDHIHKICANHLITKDMELKAMQGGKSKSWIWTTFADFSDETSKVEQLAVRFKLPEEADEFKTVFDDCKANTQDGVFSQEKPMAQPSSSKDSEKRIAEKFAPKPGSWSCTICLLNNDASTRVCVACGAAKLDDVSPGKPVIGLSTQSPQAAPTFSFKIPTNEVTSNQASPQFSFGVKPVPGTESKGTVEAPTFSFAPQPTSGSATSSTPFAFNLSKSTFSLAPFGVSDATPPVQKPAPSFGGFTFGSSKSDASGSGSSTPLQGWTTPSTGASTPVFGGIAKELDQNKLTFGSLPSNVSPGFDLDDDTEVSDKESNDGKAAIPVARTTSTTTAQGASFPTVQFVSATPPKSSVAPPAATSAITPQSFWEQDMNEKFAFGNLHRTEPLAGMAPASGKPNVWYPASLALTSMAAEAKDSQASTDQGEESLQPVKPTFGVQPLEATAAKAGGIPQLGRSELLRLLQAKSYEQSTPPAFGSSVSALPNYGVQDLDPALQDADYADEYDEEYESETGTESGTESYSSNEPDFYGDNRFVSPSGSFMPPMATVPLQPNQAAIQQVLAMQRPPMEQAAQRTQEASKPPSTFMEPSPIPGRRFLTARSPVRAAKKQEDDCLIIYEIKAAKGDRERAEQLLLPANFFNYARADPCKGCLGCQPLESVNTMQLETDKPQSKASASKDQEVPEFIAAKGKGDGLAIFGASSGLESLTFASITSPSKETFGSKTASKAFAFAGQQLFSSPADGEGTEEEADVHFKAVIPLPDLIEVVSGEENHEVCFSERAKLFRFDSDLSAWKERGVGDMKLLRDLASGRGRVIMRRDQIHKLCANHWIVPEMELKPNMGSDRSWVWQTPSDFSDSVPTVEQLAVRFKYPDTAARFKEAFEELKTVTPVSEDQLKSTAAKSTVDIPSSENNKQPQDITIVEPTKSGFKFHTPSQKDVKTAAVPVFKFGTEGNDLFGSTPLFTIGRESRGDEEVDVEEEILLSPSKSSPSKSPSKSSTQSESEEASLSGFALGLGTPSKFTFRLDISTENVSPQRSPVKSPVAMPKTPTSPESPGLYSEGEDDGIHFEPVISLPKKIDIKTGEEDEVPLFCHRAKLYRFDKQANQWKERGLGDIKILRNPTTKKSRVLMRRENVLKICANHQITPDMILIAKIGSDRTWVWHTLADISDDVPREESLAVRFKTAEIADEFRNAFELVLEEAKETHGVLEEQKKEDSVPEKLQPKPSPQKSPSLLYSKEANDTEKEKAEQLQLPERFFAGETKKTTEADNSTVHTKDQDKSIIKDVPKPFLFGSSDISSLSFANVAPGLGASPIGQQSPDKNKGFAGVGATLFQSEDTEHVEEDHEGPHFEPIIPLPEKIQVKTGEENEEVLFAHRAKLYRYDSTLKQWKERGLGEIKLLSNRKSGRCRVLMRREQVLKICANHFITPEMTLTPNAGSDKSLVWNTFADFSEEEVKPEQFAVRFKLAETTTQFKQVFEESKERLKMEISSEKDETSGEGQESKHVTEETSGVESGSLIEKFKPKPGAWNCETCLVQNKAESTACAACQTPKPGAEQNAKPVKSIFGAGPSNTSFTFGSQAPSKEGITQQPKFSFGTQTPAVDKDNNTAAPSPPQFQFGVPKDSSISTYQPTFAFEIQKPKPSKTETVAEPPKSTTEFSFGTQSPMDKFKPKPGAWECDACLVQNKPDTTSCAACQTPKPGATQHEKPDVPAAKPLFSFGVPQQKTETKPADVKPLFGFGVEQSEPETAAKPPATGFTFGTQDSTMDKFKPKPGAWDCEMCLVQNKPDTTLCAACQTPKPGAEQDEKPDVPAAQPVFSFGIPQTETKPEDVKPVFSFGVPQHTTETKPADVKPIFGFGVEQSEPETAAKPPASGVTFGTQDSTMDKFKPKPGAWDCDACLVQNKPDMTSCAACQTPKPGAFQDVKSDTAAAKPLFSFGVPQENTETKPTDVKPLFGFGVKQSVPETAAKPLASAFGTQDSTMDKFKPTPGAWDCEMCLVQNKPDTKICAACQTPKPGAVGDDSKSAPSTFTFAGAKGGGFTFGAPSGDTQPPKFAFGAPSSTAGDEKSANQQAESETMAKPFSFGVPVDTNSASQSASDKTESEKQPNEDVILVSALTPTSEEVHRAEGLLLPRNFFLFQRSRCDLGSDAPTRIPKAVDRKVVAVVPQEETKDDRNDGGKTVFGSSNVKGVSSFGDIATGPGFQTKSGFAGFSGQGSQLFAAPQPGDSPETEADGIHFKPLVSLPEVEAFTGEENEQVLFSHRAKLYRYDKNTTQWKERGVGDIKLLKHVTQNKFRVLMRRDQIRKLCANHIITADMKLLPNSGSDRSWVWTTLADLSENTPKAEQLAVKFKSVPVAHQFKEMFEDCQQKLGTEEPKRTVRDIASVFETSEKVLPSVSKELTKQLSVGSTLFSKDAESSKSKKWTCKNCGLLNSMDLTKCLGCSQYRPALEKTGTLPIIQDLSEKWECGTCLVHNSVETRECSACGTQRDQQEQRDQPESDGGSKQSDSTDGGEATEQPGDSDKEDQIEQTEDRPSDSFLFGASSVSSISFNDVPSEVIGPGFFSQPSPAHSYPEIKKEDEEDGYHNTSGDHIHFEPIISLPEAVKTVTGEENEEVLFKERAKLYRYDKDVKQWKDRGLGDIKILKNADSGRSRVVMRREQIHKLCANHLITADMELKPNAGSDRSWIWQTLADFSEDKPNPEQLAIRFKSAELALKFKESFDQCRDIAAKSEDEELEEDGDLSEPKGSGSSTPSADYTKESSRPSIGQAQSSQSTPSDKKELALPSGSPGTFSESSSTVTRTSTTQMKVVQKTSSGATVMQTEKAAASKTVQEYNFSEADGKRTEETKTASVSSLQESQTSSPGAKPFQSGFRSPFTFPSISQGTSTSSSFGMIQPGVSTSPFQGFSKTEITFGQSPTLGEFGKSTLIPQFEPTNVASETRTVTQQSASMSATQTREVSDGQTTSREQKSMQQAAQMTKVETHDGGQAPQIASCSPEITKMLDDIQQSSKSGDGTDFK